MKNSYIYMIGEVVPRLLNFLMLPIMTRYLTPADYGVIAYVDAIILFVFIFSIINLNSYLLREYFEMTTVKAKKRLIGNFFIFLVAYNVALTLILFLVINLMYGLTEQQVNILPILTIALVCNFVDIICTFPQIIYRVQEKAISFVCFTASKTFITILAIIFFLEYYYEEHGPITKYFGILLVAFIYGIISFFITRKNAIFSFNISQIKDGLFFALPLVIGSLSFAIIDVSDRIILENYVSMSDIGIYSVAYTLGFSINIILRGGYKAFEPIIFKNSKNSNFLKIFNSIKKEYLILIFCACLLVITYSHEVVFFMLPDEYSRAGSLMPIIVLAAFVKGVYTINVMLIMIAKETKVIAKIVLIGALVNIGINLLFIDQFGIIVAALSTFISFFIMALAVHLQAFNYYRFSVLMEFRDYIFLIFLSCFAFIQYYFTFPINYYFLIIKTALIGTLLYAIFRFYIRHKSRPEINYE